MALYLCDLPYGKTGLEIAKRDKDAKIVLIKDGVYLNTEGIDAEIYAMDDDVEKRGLIHRMRGKAELIDYNTLVDLALENKVVNFA